MRAASIPIVLLLSGCVFVEGAQQLEHIKGRTSAPSSSVQPNAPIASPMPRPRPVRDCRSLAVADDPAERARLARKRACRTLVIRTDEGALVDTVHPADPLAVGILVDGAPLYCKPNPWNPDQKQCVGGPFEIEVTE